MVGGCQSPGILVGMDNQVTRVEVVWRGKPWLLHDDVDNMTREVTPVDDTGEHICGVGCRCRPKVERWDTDGEVVLMIIHHAWDGREVTECAVAEIARRNN